MADARFCYWGTFIGKYIKNIPYKSKGTPTLGTHKLHNFTVIPVLIIGYQQPLELRYMALGNDDQALPPGNHVVVGENH